MPEEELAAFFASAVAPTRLSSSAMADARRRSERRNGHRRGGRRRDPRCFAFAAGIGFAIGEQGDDDDSTAAAETTAEQTTTEATTPEETTTEGETTRARPSRTASAERERSSLEACAACATRSSRPGRPGRSGRARQRQPERGEHADREVENGGGGMPAFDRQSATRRSARSPTSSRTATSSDRARARARTPNRRAPRCEERASDDQHVVRAQPTTTSASDQPIAASSSASNTSVVNPVSEPPLEHVAAVDREAQRPDDDQRQRERHRGEPYDLLLAAALDGRTAGGARSRVREPKPRRSSRRARRARRR